MENVVIACMTLKEELRHAMKELQIEYPVMWLKSGLHNVVENLHNAMQKKINEASRSGYNRILFAFGTCGNAVNNLYSCNCELVIPRTDDCISLLLGLDQSGINCRKTDATYYITKGWLNGERNIWTEYRYAIEKYGITTGKYIFNMMFQNYRKISVLDTHCYEMDEVIAVTEKIAEELGLSSSVADASNEYLKLLLSGPWTNGHFLTIPANHYISLSDLEKV